VGRSEAGNRSSFIDSIPSVLAGSKPSPGQRKGKKGSTGKGSGQAGKGAEAGSSSGSGRQATPVKDDGDLAMRHDGRGLISAALTTWTRAVALHGQTDSRSFLGGYDVSSHKPTPPVVDSRSQPPALNAPHKAKLCEANQAAAICTVSSCSLAVAASILPLVPACLTSNLHSLLWSCACTQLAYL
jgi:hypothetical protein